MHIGLIIDGLAGGGAERVVLTLAEGMVRRGHRVTVVSLRNICAYPLPNGVELLLVQDQYQGPLRRLREIPRRAHQLDQLLRRQYFGAPPFDLVISHLPKTDRIVAATACLGHAWFCLHGAIASTQLTRRKGLKHWLKTRQLRHTYHGKKWIAVSAGLATDMQEQVGAIPRILKVIGNPIDIAAIRQLAQAYCPLQNENFILHIGRFHPVKRHDRLIKAFSQCGFTGKLVLLGAGNAEQETRLHQLVQDHGLSERVIFVGFQENPYRYIRAAKALVISSDHEGLPLVLVEALACGTQVISTRYYPQGPVDILSGQRKRCICDPTAEALAITIRQTLANPIPITKQETAEFELEHVIDKYLALASLDKDILYDQPC